MTIRWSDLSRDRWFPKSALGVWLSFAGQFSGRRARIFTVKVREFENRRPKLITKDKDNVLNGPQFSVKSSDRTKINFFNSFGLWLVVSRRGEILTTSSKILSIVNKKKRSEIIFFLNAPQNEPIKSTDDLRAERWLYQLINNKSAANQRAHSEMGGGDTRNERCY